MDERRRSEYVEYIAAGVRYAQKGSGIRAFPRDTIIVVKSYSELVKLDSVLGWPIFVVDMPSSYDFFLAFPAEDLLYQPLQKYFLEYINLYPMEA